MTKDAIAAPAPKMLFKKPKLDNLIEHIAGWALVVALAVFFTQTGMI